MLELFSILRKWQWKILVPSILFAIIAIVASMPVFMPPKYDSTAVFYMANPSASDRSTIFNSEIGFTNYFGGSDDIDRILSMLQSPMFADYMIQRYSLEKHYNTKELYYTRLEWNNNFSAEKNDFGAVNVTIKDINAELAKSMADATLHYVDSAYKNWILDTRKQVLSAVEAEIASFPLDGDKDILAKLQLTKAQYRTSYSNTFSTLYVTEYPQVALKKYSPIRWMIVLGTFFLSLFVFSLLATVLEKIRTT